MVIEPVNHSYSMEFADKCLCSNRVSGHLCSCSFCGSRKGTADRWWFTEPPIKKLDQAASRQINKPSILTLVASRLFHNE